MSVTRSPPSNLNPSMSYDSDSACDHRTATNVISRQKRKRELDENREMTEFRAEMRSLITALSNSVVQQFNELKEQNAEMQKCLQFISDKYDSLSEKINALEVQKADTREHINFLETRVEILERKLRAPCLEIRNLPPPSGSAGERESKSNLCEAVKRLANTINVELMESDIRDIFRTKSRNDSNNVIVELASVPKKESILQAVKTFNKTKNVGERLNSKHLMFDAREFARENKFKYCWTSRGIVFLRKADKQPPIRIESEKDLTKLSQK
ncbi:hypothetical protein ACJJTC_003652 [Scirpophaga incertulas]